MSRGRLTNLAMFGRALLRNPKQIGAICPSSIFLARRMSEFLTTDPSHWVVELGAGTGAITSGLLRSGLPPERLIAVEKSAELAAGLERQFPGVRIICGDAKNLEGLLNGGCGAKSGKIGHVVSSIPLKLLPH